MPDNECPSQRLILQPPRGEDDVARYATAQNWAKEREIPEDDERGTLREVVWRVSSEVTLHFIVDDMTGCPYVFFNTPWKNIGAGFVQHASHHLDVFARNDLAAAFDRARDPRDRANTLLMLALASPRELEEEFFELIVSTLEDPEAVVRRAAVYATTYTPSSLYRPHLTRIAKRDPSKTVRELAQDVLGAFDDCQIGEREAPGLAVKHAVETIASKLILPFKRFGRGPK